MCSGASKFVKNIAYRFSGSQVSMISTSLDEKKQKAYFFNVPNTPIKHVNKCLNMSVL